VIEVSMPEINIDMTFGRPDHVRFVELLKPTLVGDRVCEPGDVIAVKPPGISPRNIMPVDPMLYFDRATKLIEVKRARAHPGPATVELGHSTVDPHKAAFESGGQQVEQQALVSRSERATAAPQRKGAM
jgi:hypothetical protein